MNYPILALIITNVIWGAASPIFKFALGNIPPFTLAFIRFFLASFIFLPLVIKKWQKISFSDLLLTCLAGFFGITVNIAFFFLGLLKAPSINAPIITSSAPIILFLFAVLFLKERPKRTVFLGMFIALIGTLTIILSPFLLDGRKLMLGQFQGNLFFVLAMMGMIFKPLFNKKTSVRINVYQITFIEFIVGALTFLPFMFGELQKWSFNQLDVRGLTGIIFGVFFSSALAYFLFNWGISKLPAQEVGIFYYIDPIAALLIAMPLLNEYPTIYYFFGAVLVFLGIFIAEKRLHYHPIHKIRE